MATPTTTAASAARITTITTSLVATAGQLYTLSVPAQAPKASAAAQSILDAPHSSPTIYNPGDPLKLFIIQLVIIISLSRGLGLVLKRLKQPAVISEVIGGLILGPSIMGRVPGFTQNIFPPASIPGLTLVANIGLVIFLFLVGLEADFSVFKKNGKSALAISVFGLAIPFGLGVAVSVGIYNRFIDTADVDFGIFLLFIGTAMAITAFPVLARILTELKLLSNPVGLAVLAAGVGNDVVGWILLALSVALANAGAGVSAVYILLTGVGICLFLWFMVKPVYGFLVRRSGSYEKGGPTAFIMMITFIITFSVAFLTDIIGIHPIFGSFLVGLLVIPRHKGFAAAITEKLEDMVTILFIPLYFALSGLKTDLGLLNNGAIWGWVVCVIVVAFFSKFLSCAGAAKVCGYNVRESLAIGSLMSCKGLVELIVLNIGLQAGILNNSVFAMFVVMALVTTFATTPLVMAFYPESYWRPRGLTLAGSEDATARSEGRGTSTGTPSSKDESYFRRRFLVVLQSLESLPSMMAFVRLLQPQQDLHVAQRLSSQDSLPSTAAGIEPAKEPALDDGKPEPSAAVPTPRPARAPLSARSICVDAYRLLALSERTSALFKASDAELTKRGDSILNIFSAFAHLAGIPFTTSMSIVPEENYVETVTERAADTRADLVVVPWSAGSSLRPEDSDSAGNRLESLFGQQAVERSPQFASFVRRVFLESESAVGLFLDAGHPESSQQQQPGQQHDEKAAALGTDSVRGGGGDRHIYLPFHGGPDDRAALDFLMQLVSNNPHMTATVARFEKVAESPASDATSALGKTTTDEGSTSPLTGGHTLSAHQFTVGAGLGHQDTVYAGAQNTQHRLASDTADNLALARYFSTATFMQQPSASSNTGDASEAIALTTDTSHASPTSLPPHVASRVYLRSVRTSEPLRASLDLLNHLRNKYGPVLVVAGRSRRSAPSHRLELERYLKDKAVAGAGLSSLGIAASSEVRKTLGDIGSAVIVSGAANSVLIMQTPIKGEATVKGKFRKAV